MYQQLKTDKMHQKPSSLYMTNGYLKLYLEYKFAVKLKNFKKCDLFILWIRLYVLFVLLLTFVSSNS